MRRGLRPHRTHTKRWTAVVLALATVGALAVTGLALAAAGSSVNFSFQPSNPHGTVTSGRLAFGTHTSYTGSTTMRGIALRFDDDIQFHPNSLPKCDPADISGNITMQDALQACGPAAGAANNAWLWHANAAFSNGNAQYNVASETPTACVLMFNGMGSTSEVLMFIRMRLEGVGPIDCGGPTTNTDGDHTFLIQGDLKANPAIGADFTDPDNCSAPDPRRGCQIDFTNVSDGPIRLVHLATQIGRLGYVRAKCVDPPAGNRLWNLQTVFTSANPTGPLRTQTVTDSQTCT
jgi:hypothetical protein